MQIVFNLSDVFLAESDRLENAKVLSALLNALIASDVAYLEHHKAPSLYGSGVRYGRTNQWERIPDVMRRRYGDCKSFAAWRIAELRKQGVRAEPVFRFNPRPGIGVPDFHILVQTAQGYEDPSKVLGMNKNENAYFGGR